MSDRLYLRVNRVIEFANFFLFYRILQGLIVLVNSLIKCENFNFLYV